MTSKTPDERACLNVAHAKLGFLPSQWLRFVWIRIRLANRRQQPPTLCFDQQMKFEYHYRIARFIARYKQHITMKQFLLAVLIAAAPMMVSGQELVTTIKQEAQKCANAALTNDFEGIVAYTHPRIVTQIGGKEAMIGILKSGTDQMHANGIKLVEVTIGTPEAPKTVGSWITSTVSQHIVMKVPDGKLYRDSFLLGISEDSGKHWVFVDLGPITQEQLEQVFPELKGKIAVPEKKEPVFKKDEKP